MSAPTAPAEINLEHCIVKIWHQVAPILLIFWESIDQYVDQAALAQEVASLKNTIHDRPTTL